MGHGRTASGRRTITKVPGVGEGRGGGCGGGEVGGLADYHRAVVDEGGGEWWGWRVVGRADGEGPGVVGFQMVWWVVGVEVGDGGGVDGGGAGFCEG